MQLRRKEADGAFARITKLGSWASTVLMTYWSAAISRSAADLTIAPTPEAIRSATITAGIPTSSAPGGGTLHDGITWTHRRFCTLAWDGIVTSQKSRKREAPAPERCSSTPTNR